MQVLSPPPLNAPRRVQTTFLELIERRLEPLGEGAALADWRLLMGRSTEGSLSWQLLRHRLLSSERLRHWAQEMRRSARDRALARRFELLGRVIAEALVEQHPTVARPRAGLEQRIVGFRPTVQGRSVNRTTLREYLHHNPDRAARRSAWYAAEPLHRSLEGPLRDLVRARNEQAKELGFRSYPEYRLGFERITLSRLEELMDELAGPVRAAALEVRGRFEADTGLDDWLPWDAQFAEELWARMPGTAFAREPMVPVVLNGVRKWGFGARSLNFRIDRHDLPMGGIAFPVDPPRDVRVIVHPAGGWMHYMILFHEVGHAVHGRSTARHSPILRWHELLPGFPGFTEGIGTLFEEIPRSVEWLGGLPGVGNRLGSRVAGTRELFRLFGLSSRIAQVRSELELYRHPERALEPTRYRWLRRLGGYDAFDPLSFAERSFVDNPVQLQSYLLGTLLAKQLLATMREGLGGPTWPNPRFGPWLTDNWFRTSGEFDWLPHVKSVTGRSFGPAAFHRWARATLTEAQGGSD